MSFRDFSPCCLSGRNDTAYQLQKFHFLVRFTKLGHARFLSHRELMTVWEQAVRRAGVPIAFSEGFNPRPRLSFPSALALGIESEDEILFLHLAEWLKPDELIRRLAGQLIEGIKITKVEPFAKHQLPTHFEVTYKIICHQATLPTPETINKLLARREILVERIKPENKKIINIRPYLNELTIHDNALILIVRVTSEGTIRPEEIMPLLGISGSMTQGNFTIRKLITSLKT